MTVEKPKPKQLLRPIREQVARSNQSQFLAITCNSLEAREKSRVRGAIGFGFASHWLKNWRDSFKPITKRSNRNHVITFDSHLKTALYQPYWCVLLYCSSMVRIPFCSCAFQSVFSTLIKGSLQVRNNFALCYFFDVSRSFDKQASFVDKFLGS